MTDRRRRSHHSSTSRWTTRRWIAAILCALAIPVAAPTDADAQVRRGRQNAESSPWAPIKVAARLGYNQNPTGELLGIGAAIPILRSGRIEVAPSIDWVFIRGTRDRQISLDAYYVHASTGGAVYGGGGPAWRYTNNAAPGVPAQTFNAWSFVAGLRSGTTGVVQTQAEVRWILIPDSSLNPTAIAISIAFPLWRNPPQS